MPFKLEQYPSMMEVKSADRYMICYWYRKLKSPETPEQEKILMRICERFIEPGGFTAKISKSIGWK